MNEYRIAFLRTASSLSFAPTIPRRNGAAGDCQSSLSVIAVGRGLVIPGGRPVIARRRVIALRLIVVGRRAGVSGLRGGDRRSGKHGADDAERNPGAVAVPGIRPVWRCRGGQREGNRRDPAG